MQTRRRFVQSSAIVLGAGTLGIGLGRAPTDSSLAAGHCTSSGASTRKTLVAYASRHGSTADIAFVIAEELCAKGETADVRWIGDIRTIKDYDAVIIGSAIRYDKWLPEASEFVNTHKSALQDMPVAMFFSCLTLSSRSNKATRQAQGYAEKVAAALPTVTPDQIGQFAGVLDYGKIPLAARLLARSLFAFLGVKEGDYRDWAAIRNWATTTPALNS